MKQAKDARHAILTEAWSPIGGSTTNDPKAESNEVTSPITIAVLDGRGVTVTVPFCRARGVIKPCADPHIKMDIKMEVWFSPAAAWNGRCQGVGNGGFAGALSHSAMSGALESRCAVSSTDTGHACRSNQSDWTVGHPEKIADLGWRAPHEIAVASTAMIEVHHGKAPACSSFAGCSTGGRQGFNRA